MLNQSQQKAVAHDKGAALCLAAAGSGKTTVLQHRVKRLIESGVNPSRICCITFSKKAQENMLARLNKIGVMNAHVSTFHSLGYQMLRYAGSENMLPFGYREGLDVMKSYTGKSIIQDIIKSGFRRNGQPALDVEDLLDLKQVFKTLSMFKRNCVTVENSYEFYMSVHGNEEMAKIFSDIYRMYEADKVAANEIDFDDMIMIPVYLFDQNTKFRKYWKAQFDYVLVDEAQDNNPIQAKLYDVLVEDHRNLFIVGDDFQSIYGFMESSPENSIYPFMEKYPGASLYLLEENYRCQEHIIQAANLLSGNMYNPYNKALKPTKPQLNAITVRLYDDPQTESARIVDEIIAYKETKPEMKWSDFAVLYRVNKMSRTLEEAFVRRAIPYVIYGSSGFYARKEVKDIVDILRASVDPYRNVYAVKNILNIASASFPYPTRRLGKEFINKIDKFCQAQGRSFYQGLFDAPGITPFQKKSIADFKALLEAVSRQDTLIQKLVAIRDNCYYRYLRAEYGLTDDEDDSRMEIVSELIQAASNFKNHHSFLAHVARMQDLEKRAKDPNFDGVQMMTVHKSKGLEWDTVFVAGLNDGVLPHAYSGIFSDGQFFPTDVSEERRIAYVAFTRAATNLHLSCTLVDSKGQRVAPSMFISEVNLVVERKLTEDGEVSYEDTDSEEYLDDICEVE